MNINNMLTNSQQKHKIIWCHLYVLVSLFTGAAAHSKTKNEIVSDEIAIPDYFSVNGKGIEFFNFKKLKKLAEPLFSVDAYIKVYHLSRNYDGHSLRIIHDYV